MNQQQCDSPPELPAPARLLKAAFAFPQADVWLTESEDGKRVWKTWYRGRGPLKRRFGRYLARRESRILRALAETGAVPRVHGQPRADSIEMEALEAHPLADFFMNDQAPPREYFQKLDRLVTQMHDAGITHGDLGLNNLLFDPTNPEQPLVLDFTQSLQFRLPIRWHLAWLFRMACRIDRARVAKIKHRLLGESELNEEEQRLVLHPPWYLQIGRASRKWLYHPFRRRISSNDPDEAPERPNSDRH